MADSIEATDKQQLAKIKRILTRLKLPKKPKVLKFHITLGKDSTGDDAVWIWVVVEDRNPLWNYDELKPISELVETKLREGGIGLLCYVRYRTKSEADYVEKMIDPPDDYVERF